jgi:predicted regulator of Ras-like GTPase activity (Roadblock/LC7/MglB family)
MRALPQLIEEDILFLDRELRELLSKTDASAALVVDQGGFLITSKSRGQEFDLTTIGALASGSYLANQTIANLVQENGFNSVYQQGERFSMLVLSIDDCCLLVVIFSATAGVGAVKYFALPIVRRLARRLQLAQRRAPSKSLDLSALNLADPSDIFKRKS